MILFYFILFYFILFYFIFFIFFLFFFIFLFFLFLKFSSFLKQNIKPQYNNRTHDAGLSIVKCNKKFNAIMRRTMKRLNLKPHVCGAIKFRTRMLCSAADIEGHFGTDGKVFFLFFVFCFIFIFCFLFFSFCFLFFIFIFFFYFYFFFIFIFFFLLFLFLFLFFFVFLVFVFLYYYYYLILSLLILSFHHLISLLSPSFLFSFPSSTS